MAISDVRERVGTSLVHAGEVYREEALQTIDGFNHTGEASSMKVLLAPGAVLRGMGKLLLLNTGEADSTDSEQHEAATTENF